MLNSLKNIRGITLVEILVVMALIGLMATLLGRSISRNKVDFNTTINIVLADIRLAQAKAISGAKYNGAFRCGYGIHYEGGSGDRTYSLYTSRDSSTIGFDCLNDNTNFGPPSGGDERLFEYDHKVLRDPNLYIRNPFQDIFFRSPDPKIFINNENRFRSQGNQDVEGISINERGVVNCSRNCKTICVYSSGNIEIKDGNNCR